MAISATPVIPPALTTAEALALALGLLADCFTADDVTLRTEITPDDLYRLAAQHNVPAPHGTVEGYGCHQARSELICEQCAPLEARFKAQARARQCIANAKRTALQQHRSRRGRDRATAPMVGAEAIAHPAQEARASA